MNSAFHVYYHLRSKKLYRHTMIKGIRRVRQLHQSTHPMFMISCHCTFQDISIIILDPLSRIHTLYRVFFWEERPMRKGWSGPIFKVAKRCESIVPHTMGEWKVAACTKVAEPRRNTTQGYSTLNATTTINNPHMTLELPTLARLSHTPTTPHQILASSQWMLTLPIQPPSNDSCWKNEHSWQRRVIALGVDYRAM